MTNEKIKAAAEVVTDFLEERAKDEDLDLGTVKTVGALRHEGKLTKVNLLRQLEVLRKAAVNDSTDKGGADD